VHEKSSLSGWCLLIKRQIEILEHGLGPVKDLAFAHPGSLARFIHGHKTTADELEKFKRFKATCI